MIKLTLATQAVQSVNKPFEPLTPGEYSGVIKEVRDTTIRSGRHAGKRSVDVAVQLKDGRYIWKVLPMFTTAQVKKLNEGDTRWWEMSTVSFVGVLDLVDGDDLTNCVGREIKFLVGLHQDNGYGPQNSIVKFLKK